MNKSVAGRGSWASTAGFVLASAGSAVGLGNIWRFPYITGENGGGLFVLVYLFAIALVGLPVMIAEILIGRTSQRSTVSAFKAIAGDRTGWQSLGWAGVAAGIFILSFYSVVAGWALHYTMLSIRGGIAGRSTEQVEAIFGELFANPSLNLVWTGVFLLLTVGVVYRGVERGLERWSRILMPALFVLLLVLVGRAITLPGFSQGFGFVFGLHADELTASGLLEALGHSFFTLSLGMGGLLTYGSYLRRDANVPGQALVIAGLDTGIALLACLALFPITFTHGLEPAAGPGLIFTNLPIAFAQMPGGGILALIFFSLLVFAALTSSISLLEVPVAFFIDERGWTRRKAVLVSGLAVGALAVPSALTGSVFSQEIAFGRDWFNLIADFSSNIMLPIGGFGIAAFFAWRVGDARRREEFLSGNRLSRAYGVWLGVLRYFVPIAVALVFLNGLGLLSVLGIG